MSRTMIALCVTAAFGFAAPFAAQAASTNAVVAPLSKDAYASAKKDADAQYKIEKDACASQSANARDICMAQAKGKDRAAKADALTAYENTPKHRESARVAHALIDIPGVVVLGRPVPVVPEDDAAPVSTARPAAAVPA